MRGLFLAGDWIDTGLPATIESAVRERAPRRIGIGNLVIGSLIGRLSGNRATDYPMTMIMRIVVVHYKELALKGKNRPWFIQILVRNLQDGAGAASTCVGVRSVMGRIEIELGPDAPWPEVRERGWRVSSASRTSRAPAAGRTISTRWPRRFSRDLGDRDADVVPRVSARAPTSGFRSPRRRSSARSAG